MLGLKLNHISKRGSWMLHNHLVISTIRSVRFDRIVIWNIWSRNADWELWMQSIICLIDSFDFVYMFLHPNCLKNTKIHIGPISCICVIFCFSEQDVSCIAIAGDMAWQQVLPYIHGEYQYRVIMWVPSLYDLVVFSAWDTPRTIR